MKAKLLNALVIALILLQAVAPIGALASVSTNQYIYYAGDIVYISGNEMQADEMVSVEIFFPDGSLAQHHDVAADGAGNFSDTYVVQNDGPSGDYTVVSIGQSSGNTFTTTFDPPAQVNFATSGLPDGVSITINWSKTNPQGKSATGSTTFTSPGPSGPAEGTKTGTSFTYSDFPASLTVNGQNCTRTSMLPASGFTTGADNTTTTVTATYSCVDAKVTPTLSVTNSPVIYNGAAQAAVVTGSVAGTVSNVKYDGSATAPTNVGTYAVTADFTPTDPTNYNSLTGASAGNFVIGKATPTLSVSNSPVVYNGSAQAAVVNGSVPGVVSNVKYNGSTTVPTNANTYGITADFAPTDTTNYNSLSSASAGNFIINKASVTATAGSGSGTYNGQTQSPSACLVTGAYTDGLTCTNDPASVGPDANTYAISAKVSGDTTNFEISYVGGSYTIEKAKVTATAGSGSGTYNGQTQSPDACVVTGAYKGDLTCANDPASVGPNANTYTIHPKVNGDTTNFDVRLVDGSYTISKANANCSVTGYQVTYNGAAHTADGSCTGVLGEYLSGLNLNGTTHTDAGTYNDSWTFTDSTGNYNNISSTPVTDQIDQAPVTATAGSGSGTYNGQTQSPSDCQVTGAYTGDLACVNEPTSVGPDANTYTISAKVSGTGLTNFNVSYVDGSYEIKKAPLTITANNKTIAEGASWPTFDVSYSGFVSNEGSSVLSGTLICTSTAPNPTTDNGGFSINCSGLTANNYSITYKPGTLTVNNVAPTVSALTLGNANATACLAGNAVTLNLSFTDPGVNDKPWVVDIDWGDGSAHTTYNTNSQGTQPQQSHLYGVGSFTISVKVTDKDNGVGNSTGTNTVSHLYNMSGILAPFNPDGTSVWKYGSTLPVKVRITDCNNAPVAGLAPQIGTSLVSSTDPNLTIDETASTSAADTTGIMRYDPTAGQYIYNFASKYLTDPSATYYMTVKGMDVNGKIVTTPGIVQVKFGLKTK